MDFPSSSENGGRAEYRCDLATSDAAGWNNISMAGKWDLDSGAIVERIEAESSARIKAIKDFATWEKQCMEDNSNLRRDALLETIRDGSGARIEIQQYAVF